jgi:hypothetical protein
MPKLPIRLLRLRMETRHHHRYRTHRYRRLGLALLRRSCKAQLERPLDSGRSSHIRCGYKLARSPSITSWERYPMNLSRG